MYSDNNRVQKFDSNGKFITNWTVSSPFGIAVDSGGKVYVIDQTTGGIQIYGLIFILPFINYHDIMNMEYG